MGAAQTHRDKEIDYVAKRKNRLILYSAQVCVIFPGSSTPPSPYKLIIFMVLHCRLKFFVNPLSATASGR